MRIPQSLLKNFKMYFTFLFFSCAGLISLGVHGSRLPQLPLGQTSKVTDGQQEPDIVYAAVKQLNVEDIRPFRKRPANVVQYQIKLENETFTITLRPNNNLFTPGCLVHSYLPGGRKEMYPCSRKSVNCYYTGRTDIHNDSWVAANVCNGLNGVISFDNTSLFIEPLNITTELSYATVHVVYRYQGDKQICPIEAKETENNLHVVYGKKKRAAQTQTRYIETRLVVDPAMYQFHRSRDNAVTYTMLAFNIANKLYAHQSIGTKIHLTMSELHIIQDFNDFASEWTENANRTLHNFCEWQSSLSSSVDCSVLLTRLDLQDDDGNSGINGLAKFNRMCDNDYNCALVEDEGPIVGITLAHEIGHLLGMTHDNFENGVGIMSAGGWSGNEAFSWTDQSASELHGSLTSGKKSCLDNRPIGLAEQRRKNPFSGMLYTADQQCKLRNNDSYVFYRSPFSNADPCRNIKCSFQGSHASVISAPLLDGTDCNNTRTWCMRGECVPMDGEHSWVAPVDGGWSSWTISTCSRSCGGGVQIKKRFCNNPPPQYAGKFCTGSSSESKICNIEACDGDYRSLQCSKVPYAYSLVPALGYHGDGSCFVRCHSDEGVVTNHRTFADGTECLFDTAVPFSRCVNGKCQDFGCDGKSNSVLKYDECGVCNGTGSTCTLIRGNYSEPAPPHKYTDVVTIPAGSSGIRIQQMNTYCILSMLVEGKRVLNARLDKSGSALFNLYGIQFRYIEIPESIEILEKLSKDIVIQVLRLYDYRQFVNVTPDIIYTYNKPSPGVEQAYAWAEIPNGSCSRTCGGGVSFHDVKCMNSSGLYVADFHCDIGTRPKATPSPCNTQPCPLRWKPSRWGQCSVSCGNGTKTRTATCVRLIHGVDQIVSSNACNLGLKPHLTSRCYIRCEWRPENWSKCTRTCGEGYKTRSVTCIQYNGIPTQIAAKYCDQESRPIDMIRCRHGPCYVLNGTCVDKKKDCKKYYDYEKNACDGSYKQWMSTNCLQTCGVCGNGTCVDEETCRKVDPSIDACNHPKYSAWMHLHCPQSCNICQDCADCSKYDVKYCTDSMFEGFMRKNCAKSCKFC